MLLSDAAMDSVVSGRSLKETLLDLWNLPNSTAEFLDTVCDELGRFRSMQEDVITSESMTHGNAKDFRKRANNVCNEIARQVRGLTDGDYTIKCVSRKNGHKYESVKPTPRPSTGTAKSGGTDKTTFEPEKTHTAQDVIEYYDNKCTNEPMVVLKKLLDIHGDDTFKELLMNVVASRG